MVRGILTLLAVMALYTQTDSRPQKHDSRLNRNGASSLDGYIQSRPARSHNIPSSRNASIGPREEVHRRRNSFDERMLRAGLNGNAPTKTRTNLGSPKILNNGRGSLDARGTEGDFVFPETEYKPTMLKPTMVPCSSGQTFCEKVENYPTDVINKIIEESVDASLLSFFGVDEVATEIEQRNGNVAHEIGLCSSTPKLVYPQQGQTKSGSWETVVNTDMFKQGINVEICENVDSICINERSWFDSLGYVSSCKQKYVYRRMVAVNAKNQTYRDDFSMPSCCSCILELKENTNKPIDFGRTARRRRSKRDV